MLTLLYVVLKKGNVNNFTYPNHTPWENNPQELSYIERGALTYKLADLWGKTVLRIPFPQPPKPTIYPLSK